MFDHSKAKCVFITSHIYNGSINYKCEYYFSTIIPKNLLHTHKRHFNKKFIYFKLTYVYIIF